MSRVRRGLGVARESQFYQMSGYTKRVQQQFGQFRGLLRVHFAVTEALQEWLRGRRYHVGASLCMTLQAVHPRVLDAGDWSSAHMLLFGPGHLGRLEFGAEGQGQGRQGHPEVVLDRVRRSGSIAESLLAFAKGARGSFFRFHAAQVAVASRHSKPTISQTRAEPVASGAAASQSADLLPSPTPSRPRTFSGAEENRELP